MFENAGKKVRVIAKILFWLEIIGGAAIGFTDDNILLYILGAAGGFIIGWLSTIVLHAIADIAENTERIISMLYRLSENEK